MSTPATTQASQGAFQFDRTFIGLTPFQTIFTVPAFAPALIESVYFVAAPSGGAIIAEALVLQILAPGGAVVFAQSTPIMNQDGTLGFVAAVCTWARGAVGVSAGPGMTPAATDVIPPVYNTLPLPEMTLPPGSTIEVALYEDNDGGTGIMTLQNVTVTYTPNAGPTSTTDLVDVLPLLVPTTTG